MDTLLGIDLGTTGVKVALFEAGSGEVVVSAFAAYPLMHPHVGWAEQDPAAWWDRTVEAVKMCLADAGRRGVEKETLRGIGLSGQMHGIVLLDASGEVVRPCIIWADQRSDQECRWITERVGEDRLIDLVSNPALPGFSLPKLIWVRDHEPQLFARARKVLLPKDYLRYRLTGELGMEISDAAGTCMLDVRRGSWSG